MAKTNQTPVLFMRTLKLLALRGFVVLALLALFVPLYSFTRGHLQPDKVSAAVGINRQINFQGKLVNPDGTNVTNGNYTIVFSIYTVASGGANIWTESQTVALSNGIFQVNLGSVTALPGSVDFNTDNIYLGIKVGADAEMTPRVQFTAVPQAFNAEKLGGLDKTGFIQNSTALQATSNYYIQSNNAANVTAKFRAAASQTADIIQVRNSTDTTTVFAVSPAGTITAGTWNGTAVSDAYVDNNLTVDWAGLQNYPAACSAGQAISAVGDTLTCISVASGSGSGNYIQNQYASAQSASQFWISGNGRIDGVLTAAGGGALSGNITIATTAGNTLALGNSTGALTVTGSAASTFVINGVTVDATEFNRLDGKDAALVDTNDAVATAITGTGALNAGSITSSFGTIDNADTITGTTLNGTTGINTGAGAGTQRIDASGNLVNVGNITASGTVNSANSRSVNYTSLTGASNDWFPLFTLNDSTQGTVLVNLKTYAHSSVTFTVAQGYGASNAARINVLNAVNSTNGGYANISGIRILQDGSVEVRLTWSTGPTVSVSAQIIGTTATPAPAASLATSVNASTVVDTVSSLTNGLMRAGGNLEIQGALSTGGTTRLTAAGLLQNVTYNGTSIADAYLDNNITVDWTGLQNYPAACAAGSAITALNDAPTCTAFATATGGTGYIQNQTASPQAAGFNINGNGTIGGTLAVTGAATFTSTVAASQFNGSGAGLTGTAASLNIGGNAATATNLSTTRLDWSTNGTITGVVGQLAWKNYGNGHTIFDASQGTAPDGSARNNTNPEVAWGATYPTLMGWNGANTYGVRVDSARSADNAGLLDGLDSTAFAPASGSGNYINNTTSPQSANFNITGNGTMGGTLTVTGNATFDTNTLFVNSATNRVGVGNVAPNTELDVSGVISRAQNSTRIYKNVYSYNISAPTQTGTIVLAAPKGKTDTMLRFTIKGYDYSGSGAWEANVSGYSYSGAPYWYNTSAEITGSAPFTSIRLGYVGSNAVIMLGTTATVWQYPKVVIEEIIAGHSSVDDWGGTWTGSLVTSEAAYADINSPVVRQAAYTSQTFLQGGNSFGTTATLGTNDAQSLVLETANTARLTIDSAGNSSFSGTITGTQLISTVATGTAPLQVTSTTQVNNLNVQYLQGATPSMVAGNSTIVQRNASGYVLANYFNTTADVTAGAATHFAIQTGSDNYIRWQTPANARTSLGVTAGGAGDIWVEKAGDTMSGDLTFSNGRKGLVGSYDAAQTQAVFAMGGSYLLPNGGASNNYGSFYGIGWSYNPDYGGAGNNPQSKAGLNHQALFMMNGVTQSSIGTGIWTIGGITGTSLNVASGAITSGLINGQTISSAANFTGTLAVTGNGTVGDLIVGSSSYSSGSLLDVGAAATDYQGNSGWAGAWNSNILLTGLDYSTISFHDAGTSVGTFGYHGNEFFFDGGGTWGPVQLGINTRTPGHQLDVQGGDINTSGTYKINGVTICTSGGCTGNATTLQGGYTASTGGTTPEIKLDATRGGFDIQDANTTISGSLLTVRASNGAGLGSSLFDVNSNGRVSVAGSSVSYSRPAIPAGAFAISSSAAGYYQVTPSASSIAKGDLNNDGYDDVVTIGTSSVSVLINNAGNGFNTKVDYASLSTGVKVFVNDYNGDGNKDVLVIPQQYQSGTLFLGNGNGTLQTGLNVGGFTGNQYTAYTSADFNKDGKYDIGAVDNNGATKYFTTFLSTGTTFTSTAYVAFGTDSSQGVDVADFNNDTHMDMITCVNNSGGVYIGYGQASGVIGSVVSVYIGSSGAGSCDGVKAGDYNGDGNADFTTNNWYVNSSITLYGNGAGTFGSRAELAMDDTTLIGEAADLNSDGKLDNIFYTATKVVFMISNGTSFYKSSSNSIPVGNRAYGNFTGSGFQSLANTESSSVVVYANLTSPPIAAETGSVATLSLRTTNSSSGGLFIQSSAGQTASLFAILNSAGNGLLSVDSSGNLRLKGAVSGGYGSPDYAENISASDPSIEAADVVTMDPSRKEWVVKSSTSYDQQVIGVISTNPGFVTNATAPDAEDGTQRPLALSGRVPVKITTENGPVAPGDYLTTSSIPGHAMRATQAGPTIGRAMEAFDGNGNAFDCGASRCGRVLMFIDNSYYNPSDGNNIQGADMTLTGSLGIAGNATIGGSLNVSGHTTLTTLAVTGDVAIGGSLTVTGDITTQNITVNGHIITAGDAPGVVTGAAAGQAGTNEPNPVIAIDGNDSAGTVSVTTGSQNLANGVLAHISFAEAFAGSYKVVLSASNDPAGLLRVHTVKTATGFDIVANDATNALTQYDFDYIVLGTQMNQ